MKHVHLSSLVNVELKLYYVIRTKENRVFCYRIFDPNQLVEKNSDYSGCGMFLITALHLKLYNEEHLLSGFWVREPFVGLPVSQCREEEEEEAALINTHIQLKPQQLVPKSKVCSALL